MLIYGYNKVIDELIVNKFEQIVNNFKKLLTNKVNYAILNTR